MDTYQPLTDLHSITMPCGPLPSLTKSTVPLQMSNFHLVLHVTLFYQHCKFCLADVPHKSLVMFLPTLLQL